MGWDHAGRDDHTGDAGKPKKRREKKSRPSIKAWLKKMYEEQPVALGVGVMATGAICFVLGLMLLGDGNAVFGSGAFGYFGGL